MKSGSEHGTEFCVVPTTDGLVMVPYILRRSRRSRYLRLSLEKGDCAVLTVPRHVSEGESVGFLKEHGDWLSSQSAGRRRPVRDLIEYLLKQTYLSVDGARARVIMRFTAMMPVLRYEPRSRQVTLQINAGASVDAQIALFLKDFARDVVAERAREVARKVNVRFLRVTIRDQRRCWGSCSERRTISLNWRLLLLAPELQDYIIYHELAHLTHFNHSIVYWALLRKYDRCAVRHDKRISRISSDMLALGRS